MKDINKIASNIDKFISIEQTMQELKEDLVTEPVNPYLCKNKYEPRKERVPVLISSAMWVEERRREIEQSNMEDEGSPHQGAHKGN